MLSRLPVIVFALLILLTTQAMAQPPQAQGEVTVPLPAYTELLEQTREEDRPAQAEYAIGEARIHVALHGTDEQSSATVTLSAVIETFAEQWTLVPILPAGVAIGEVRIDDRPTALVQTEEGLAWSTRQAATVDLSLRYSVDAQRSGQSWLLPIPLPRTASTQLEVRYPGLGVELTALPATAASQQTDPENQLTILQATLPASDRVTISWREPLARSHALGRASYRGEYRGEALAWRAEYQVAVYTDEAVTLALLPDSVTLSDLRVDGEPATALLEEQHFAVALQGRGSYRVQVDFQTPVLERDGPPAVRFAIPAVPVSRFELQLPGSKEVSVEPAAHVETETRDDTTVATVFLPLSEQVMFSWVETIPEEMRGQVRANASVYHLIHAEPGVLLGRALAVYEISHGETDQLRLEIPDTAQVNRIRGPGVSDWSVGPGENDGYNRITVFLDRALQGEYTLDIDYERLLGADSADTPIAVPLLNALDLNRQRGVVALLAGPELGLEPVDSTTLVDVSEHQLPQSVRDDLTMKVARTYKYVDPSTTLLVNTVAPERRQARINVGVYHALRAEPGVLLGRAFALYEISQGETDLLELDIAAEAQINRISAPQHPVADWSLTQADDQGRKQLQIFLEAPARGELLLEVEYERLLDSDTGEIATPLLQARKVNRQRGMIALLAGTERVLEPVSSEGVSGAGEDQLPALVRNQLEQTVAHTYRYIGELPLLSIQVATPERQQGLFDARVDTLISLGEVSLRGAASVEINVKSGTLMDLALTLPADLNVLSVTGPSLREQRVESTPGGPTIDLAFTQEMAGQFRLEVVYERILAGADGPTPIPTPHVAAAEIEHGRIAVEALTAVELGTASASGLSSIDSNELPRQLVLKTTNPILLAYKYVRADQPFNLALDITRHRDIELQAAAIETADYLTLYTRDGLAVTVAKFQVRNSRRQFLRLALPAGSQVWSTFVNGQAEKPARADDGDGVLIKLLNASHGFPVEVVYATPVAPMGRFGSLDGQLPRPDIIVTRSQWWVLLPADFRYWRVSGNLDVLGQGRRIQPGADTTAALQEVAAPAGGGALRMDVPTQGIELRFAKLYANQGAGETGFRVRYLSAAAGGFGNALVIPGTILLWVMLLSLWRASGVKPPRLRLAGALLGAVLLLLGLRLGGDIDWALGASLVVLLVMFLWFFVAGRRKPAGDEAQAG